MSREMKVTLCSTLLKGEPPKNWWGGFLARPVAIELIEIRGEENKDHDKVIFSVADLNLASNWGEVGTMEKVLEELRKVLPFECPPLETLLHQGEWKDL
jgi:hypothetical protein